MANPLKGEVAFEAGGKEYVFSMKCGDLIALQTAWGFPPEQGAQFWARVRGSLSPALLVEIFRHGLKRYHSDVVAQPGAVEGIIDELELERSIEVYADALIWTMPEVEKQKARAKKEGKGPKAKSGTGASS